MVVCLRELKFGKRGKLKVEMPRWRKKRVEHANKRETSLAT